MPGAMFPPLNKTHSQCLPQQSGVHLLQGCDAPAPCTNRQPKDRKGKGSHGKPEKQREVVCLFPLLCSLSLLSGPCRFLSSLPQWRSWGSCHHCFHTSPYFLSYLSTTPSLFPTLEAALQHLRGGQRERTAGSWKQHTGIQT